MKNAKVIQPILSNKVALMKTSFFIITMSFFAFASASVQSPGSAAWDKGEKETLMELVLLVRQNVMDIGATVDAFFYRKDRGYMVDTPVKITKGRYTIRCIITSEYNDEKMYLTFEILRITETDALLSSILIEGIRESTGHWGQAIASTFEEKMFVLMSYFRE